MKRELQQLTLAQFIDLICGNTLVLLKKGEFANPDKLAATARSIILEYKAMADPGGTLVYFSHIEEWLKAKMGVIIFTICDNLVTLGQYTRAKEILEAYGLTTSSWNDSRVSGTARAKLARWQRKLHELEAENEQAVSKRENIRAQFYSQIAAIMAHFKFQINPNTIQAPIYANLVARYNREAKAIMAARQKGL